MSNLPQVGMYENWTDWASALLSSLDTSVGGALSGESSISLPIYDSSGREIVSAGGITVYDVNDLAFISPGSVVINTEHLVDAAITTAKLKDLSVDIEKLTALSVDASKIVDGSIITNKVAAGSITAPKMAVDSVGSASIQDTAILTTHLTDGVVNSNKLLALSVIAGKIANGAVGSSAIATAAVGNTQLAALAVEAENLANSSVTSTKIANLAVGTAAIALAAIGEAQIATAAVGSAAIQAAAIGTAHIGDLAVTTAKIKNWVMGNSGVTFPSSPIEGEVFYRTDQDISYRYRNTVWVAVDYISDPGRLVDGVITNVKIADAAISSAKIANATINTAHIQNAAVGSAAIAAAAIGTAHIANGVITSALIGEAQILTAHIGAAQINELQVADGAITNLKILNGAIGRSKVSDTLESDNWNPTTKAGMKLDFANGLIEGQGVVIYDAAGNIAFGAGGTLAWSKIFNDGNAPANNADITALNTAAGITGQGALATANNIDLVTQVVGFLGAANADSALINSQISISAGGFLNGAGGGQVTIGGLGYIGDLNATVGAPAGTNVGNLLAEDYEQNSYDPGMSKGLFGISAEYNGKYVAEYSGAGASAVSNMGYQGGDVIRCVGTKWLYGRKTYPVDVNKTYRVKFRVKQIVDDLGKSSVYAGVVCLNGDYIYTNDGGSGSYRYCAVFGTQITVAGGWTEFEGTISGVGGGYNNFRSYTKFIRPMCIVNYQGGSGTADVDWLEFEEVVDYDKVGGVKPPSDADKTDYAATVTTTLIPSNSDIKVTGTTLEKITGTSVWTTKVHSIEKYASGAYVSFTVQSTNKEIIVGLTDNHLSSTTYASIDYALFFTSTNKVYVYEAGASKGEVSPSYLVGDAFAVENDGVKVRYYQNGILIYTSLVIPAQGASFYMNASLYTVGGKISNVHLGSMSERVSNTNQLTDGSNLGGTANWATVTSRPTNLAQLDSAQDAKLGLIYTGANSFSTLIGQLTVGNISSYIQGAAIGTALIQDAAITNALIANGTIANAKIADLEVSKLTSGNLGAIINLSGASRIVFNTGTHIQVEGLGFGSSNQFIEWFGPIMAENLMTEANSITHRTMTGDVKITGTLHVGTLYNTITGTEIAVPSSTSLGPFGSNGGTIIINYSYSYTHSGKRVGDQTPTGTMGATVKVYRKVGSGSETLIATLTPSGSVGMLVYDGDLNRTTFACQMSGNGTYTDTDMVTTDRTYRIEVETATLFSVPGTPIGADVLSQNKTLISSEG